MTLPAADITIYMTMSAATIVEPTGVPATTAISMPESEQTTVNTAATAQTAQNDFATFIAATAGTTRSD